MVHTIKDIDTLPGITLKEFYKIFYETARYRIKYCDYRGDKVCGMTKWTPLSDKPHVLERLFHFTSEMKIPALLQRMIGVNKIAMTEKQQMNWVDDETLFVKIWIHATNIPFADYIHVCTENTVSYEEGVGVKVSWVVRTWFSGSILGLNNLIENELKKQTMIAQHQWFDLAKLHVLAYLDDKKNEVVKVDDLAITGDAEAAVEEDAEESNAEGSPEKVAASPGHAEVSPGGASATESFEQDTDGDVGAEASEPAPSPTAFLHLAATTAAYKLFAFLPIISLVTYAVFASDFLNPETVYKYVLKQEFLLLACSAFVATSIFFLAFLISADLRKLRLDLGKEMQNRKQLETQLHSTERTLATLRRKLDEQDDEFVDVVPANPHEPSARLPRNRRTPGGAEICIPEYRVSQTKGRRFALYRIEIRRDGSTTYVWKRYRQFRALFQSIAKKYGNGKKLMVNRFPPKQLFGALEPKFVEMRRHRLDDFIRTLSSDEYLCRIPELVDFFNTSESEPVVEPTTPVLAITEGAV